MAYIYQPADLISEGIAVLEEADKTMAVKNELKSVIVDENNIQQENLRNLENYALAVHRWTRKIEDNIQLLDEEIIYQEKMKKCLKEAMNAMRIAANINAETQFCRSTKLDGDYQDNVDEELKKEKILIDAANCELQMGLAEVEKYIEQMKSVKEDLERLWSYKRENYNIECENISLKQSSCNTMLKFGSNRESNRDVTGTEWEKHIRTLMDLSNNLLTESNNTHYKIKECILSTNQQKLCEQAHVINEHLNKKKREIEEYIQKLKIQLTMIVKKQNEVERTIQNTKETIKYLNQSLKLSQTRLYNRLRKPIQERFFDEAQQGLLTEEEDIRKQILSLEKVISQLEDNIRRLIAERFKVERELQLKLDNIWIDGEKCPNIRMLYPSVNDLSESKGNVFKSHQLIIAAIFDRGSKRMINVLCHKLKGVSGSNGGISDPPTSPENYHVFWVKSKVTMTETAPKILKRLK